MPCLIKNGQIFCSVPTFIVTRILAWYPKQCLNILTVLEQKNFGNRWPLDILGLRLLIVDFIKTYVT